MSNDRDKAFALFGSVRSMMGGGESRVNTSEQVNTETRIRIPLMHGLLLFFCIVGIALGCAGFLFTANAVVMVFSIALLISCIALGRNQYRYLDMPHWSTSTPDDIARRQLIYPAVGKALAGDDAIEEWAETTSTIPVQAGGQQTRTAAAPNGKVQVPEPDDLNYLEFLKGALDIGFARDGVWFKKPRRRFVLTGDKVIKSKYDEMIEMCVRRGIVEPGGGGAPHTLVEGVDLEDAYLNEVAVIYELFPDWVRLNPRFDAVHST